MKGKVQPGSVGLVFGLFMALVHAVWSTLVFFGWAKGYMDWILGLHFVSNPYVMQPFAFSKAAILVAFAFVVGYVAGWISGIVWNWVMRGK